MMKSKNNLWSQLIKIRLLLYCDSILIPHVLFCRSRVLSALPNTSLSFFQLELIYFHAGGKNYTIKQQANFGYPRNRSDTYCLE